MKIDYRDLFLTEKDILAHIHAYSLDLERYMAVFMLLQNSDVHIDWKVKEKVLGTLLYVKNEGAIEYLFTKPFWTILDIRNVIRLLWSSKEAKGNSELRLLMKNGMGFKKPRRMILTERIKEMDPEVIERSILRHSYPAWREVIDFLHIPERYFPDFEPKTTIWERLQLSGGRRAHVREMDAGAAKGHSQLLKTIMDGNWEPTPHIRMMRDINSSNAEAIISNTPSEFHYLRSKLDFEKNPQYAMAYLRVCSPANIIRWHDYLWFPSTKDIIEERLLTLSEEYVIHHPYSIYFELIYSNKAFMSVPLYKNLCQRADKMIGRFDVPLMKKAAVWVDQSSSMSEEMVQIGTVIAAHIGKQLDAELCFFYGETLGLGPTGRDARAEYEDVPLGTVGAINMVDRHQPKGNTPIAQCIRKYMTSTGSLTSYGIKNPLKSIVIITDEGENDTWNGLSTVDALKLYRDAVGHNLEVMIIAVKSEHTSMTTALQYASFNVVRYRCDDLKNIESLFAMINAKTAAFMADVQAAATRIGGSYRAGVTTKTIYVELDQDLKKYKKERDNIFASVIKGACVNCGSNIPVGAVTNFRLGNSISCGYCDFVMSPTLFGNPSATSGE